MSFGYLKDYDPNNESIALIPFRILRRLTDHFTAFVSFIVNPSRIINYIKNDLISPQTHYFQKIILASTSVSTLHALDSISSE